MQVQHARCAGLDVHKKTVVACILITSPEGQVQRYRDSFSTMTIGLLALDDGLNRHDVSQVAMDPPVFTGDRCLPFWKPPLGHGGRVPNT